MPHQCLSCGEAFEDGSTDLLKGCPSCEGTRFFFTEEPVDDAKRAELQDKTEKDVHQMLKELVDKREKRDLDQDIWSRDAWEQWIKLDKEGKLQQLVDDAELEEAGLPATGAPEGDGDGDDAQEGPADAEGSETRKPKPTLQVSLDEVEEADAPDMDEAPETGEGHEILVDAPAAAEGRPSTLNILEPGNYEIDVERLMEDSPVIVERDGSYVIHLPSVFEKGKRR